MEKMMKFSKWQGLGNDFIIVEVEPGGSMDMGSIARHACDRHFGIGADGLVPIRRKREGGFDMRIFNSDGSEAEMCGNVTRCVALHLRKYGLSETSRIELHTLAGIIRAEVGGNSVCVDMGEAGLTRGKIPMTGDPDEMTGRVKIEAGGKTWEGTAVSMGNPHFVLFVPDLAEVDLEKKGPLLESAEAFPCKANIEFAQVVTPGLIRMRVWERGCGITMACGTGACATAVAGVLTGRTENKATVILDGGELHIEFDPESRHVFMTGPAREVFTGNYIIEE